MSGVVSSVLSKLNAGVESNESADDFEQPSPRPKRREKDKGKYIICFVV